MILKNKKGYIGDIVTMMFSLFGFFVILGLGIFILVQWNINVQSSSAFTVEAKEGQQLFTDTYIPLMGWFWPAAFLGMMLYMLITSYLVEVVSKVWFVIGLMVTLGQAILGYVLSLAFEEVSQQEVFGLALQNIPGAVFYFNNIILVNVVIASMVLIALYFRRDA